MVHLHRRVVTQGAVLRAANHAMIPEATPVQEAVVADNGNV